MVVRGLCFYFRGENGLSNEWTRSSFKSCWIRHFESWIYVQLTDGKARHP